MSSQFIFYPISHYFIFFIVLYHLYYSISFSRTSRSYIQHIPEKLGTFSTSALRIIQFIKYKFIIETFKFLFYNHYYTILLNNNIILLIE